MSDESMLAAPSLSSVAMTRTAAIEPRATANPHYAQLGGHLAVVSLVNEFYRCMDTLPEARRIRALHPPELAPVKAVLVRFLSEWLGGPQSYSEERGHPRLRRRHLPFAIGPEERDAWMLCMRGALAAVCADAALRESLMQAFFRTADFIRNDADANHQPTRSFV